jgi:hypothetical protein
MGRGYPIFRGQKLRAVHRCGLTLLMPGIVARMMLWGLWALLAPLTPGLPAPGAAPSHLVMGLAVAVATLIVVVAAAGLRFATLPVAIWSISVGRRARVFGPPRLQDPDAAGRPRPRAPTTGLAALAL